MFVLKMTLTPLLRCVHFHVDALLGIFVEQLYDVKETSMAKLGLDGMYISIRHVGARMRPRVSKMERIKSWAGFRICQIISGPQQVVSEHFSKI